MGNNVEDIINYAQDVMKIVNGKNDVQTQYRNLYSTIYKIRLYSFKDGKKPYCVEDDKFEDVLNFMGSILVTIADCSHVKEIKTGKIIPIVHLIKNNDYWNSSVIMSDHLTEDDTLFTLSQNKILFPEPINISDFNKDEYLEEIFRIFGDYNKENKKVRK